MNENINSFSSDDFLSNGFYKLFAEELEDEILLFNDQSSININVREERNHEERNHDERYCDISNNCWFPSENLMQINDDFELNIDNLLFDNYLDISNWQIDTTALPDKTVLCNDSCDMFLKESSENLFSHRQQQHPHNIYNQTLHSSENNQNEKVFTCTFNDCGKVYAKATHLKAHLRRHIGDKPYVCNWPNCTWKFSRSDELSRHRRSHSGVKPYKCIYCPKCFSRSDHLTKHRKVHERKMAAALKVNTGEQNAIWTNIPTTGRPSRKAMKSFDLFL